MAISEVTVRHAIDLAVESVRSLPADTPLSMAFCAPLGSYQPVAVFDRARRVFVDGNGTVVAPLDHVRFQSAMQITSSSPKLVAVTPNGTRVLMRGNPFSGGIGNLDEVLTAAVHGVG